MKPIGFIYLTTNNINGKIYIGKREFCKDKRANSIYLGSGILIKKAVKKYGRKNFSRKMLKLCETLEELYEAEIFFIKKYDACNPKIGYNLHEGGYGFKAGDKNPSYGKPEENPFFGKHHTEESKKKMSDSKKGKPSKLKGIKMSEEARLKMSISAKKRLANPKNNSMYGKKHSEESKEKNRQSHLGKKLNLSDETRSQMSKKQKELHLGAKAINNGKVNKWLKSGEPLPEGFVYGWIKKGA